MTSRQQQLHATIFLALATLISWLIILVSPQLGSFIWSQIHGAPTTQDKYSYLSYGLVTQFLAVLLIVLLCLWQRLSLWWLLIAALVAGLLYIVAPMLPRPLGGLALLILPPLTGTLIWPPTHFQDEN